MEDIRTEYSEDDNREALIKHWESTLSNASHAVYVAQRTLEGLYRTRYHEVSKEIGHTVMSVEVSAEK